jgi:hypothetical protein
MINVKEIGSEAVDRIQVVYDRMLQRALVNMVMNLLSA